MANLGKSFKNNPFLVGILSIIIFFLGLYIGQNAQLYLKSKDSSDYQIHVQSLQLMDFVNNAAKLIETKKEAAFDEFNIQNSQWWQGDRYIFVYDMQGNTLVLPTNTSLVGVNRLDAQDEDGVYFINEMISRLQRKDTAWVVYSYPKPAQAISNLKLAFVKKIKLNDQDIFVGSGIYF